MNNMTTTIYIRLMKISDFPELFSLWKKTDLELANEKTEFSQTKLALKLNPDSCLVLVEDEKIIGSILGTFNGKRGWIYHLAIDPNFQNLGYGSKLLSRAEEALKKHGTQRMH